MPQKLFLSTLDQIYIWSHHAVLYSRHKDMRKKIEQQCAATAPFLSTRFITASHFGRTPTKYIIRVPPKPNTSSYFMFRPFGFITVFIEVSEWFSIHGKYWLHFSSRSINAVFGLFSKIFSLENFKRNKRAIGYGRVLMLFQRHKTL